MTGKNRPPNVVHPPNSFAQWAAISMILTAPIGLAILFGALVERSRNIDASRGR